MKMFNDHSFAVFKIAGLEDRMTAIRADIQPIFLDIMTDLVNTLSEQDSQSYYLHIAQHRRRSKNPPDSTWSAISTNKRGYKNEPHLQLGLWDDYVFIYLSMIDQPKDKDAYATYLKKEPISLPSDFVYSTDHTKKSYHSITDHFDKAIDRFSKVKKGELEIGRIIPKDSPIWSDNPREFIFETYQTLFPLYKALLKLKKD